MNCYLKSVAGNNKTFIWSHAACKICSAVGGVSFELAQQVFELRYNNSNVQLIACGFILGSPRYNVYLDDSNKVEHPLPKK